MKVVFIMMKVVFIMMKVVKSGQKWLKVVGSGSSGASSREENSSQKCRNYTGLEHSLQGVITKVSDRAR